MQRERKEKLHAYWIEYIYIFNKEQFSFFPFFEYDDIYKNNFLVLLFL